jgi:hypothetical protein
MTGGAGGGPPGGCCGHVELGPGRPEVLLMQAFVQVVGTPLAAAGWCS